MNSVSKMQSLVIDTVTFFFCNMFSIFEYENKNEIVSKTASLSVQNV